MKNAIKFGYSDKPLAIIILPHSLQQEQAVKERIREEAREGTEVEEREREKNCVLTGRAELPPE